MKSSLTLKSAWVAMLFLCPLFFIGSCTKEAHPESDYASIKQGWLIGNWKQQDIRLGVSTTVRLPDGTRLPLEAGSSMISDPTINALLAALLGGNPFLATVDNSYIFGSNGEYEIDGSADIIMPQVGNAGEWKLEVHGAVIALYPSTDVRAPYWINSMDENDMSLGLTINFPGLGDVPLNLLLEK